MPLSTAPEAARRSEAERLIALARALLTGKSEEMAVIYLDQAAEALRAGSKKADSRVGPTV